MVTVTKSQHSNAGFVNNFFANFVACEYSCLSSLLSDLPFRTKLDCSKIANMRNYELIIRPTFYLSL